MSVQSVYMCGSPSASFANICSWLVTRGNFYTETIFHVTASSNTSKATLLWIFFHKLRNPPSTQNTIISRSSTKPLAKRTARFYLALPVILYAAPAHTSRYTHKNCHTNSRTRWQNAHLLYVVYYFPLKDSIQYENLLVTLDFSYINYFWKNNNIKVVPRILTPRLNTFVSLSEHLFRQEKTRENFFTF